MRWHLAVVVLALGLLYVVLVSALVGLEAVVGGLGVALAAIAWRRLRSEFVPAHPPVSPCGAGRTVLRAWPVALVREAGLPARAAAQALRQHSSPGSVETLRLRSWAGAAWAGPVLSATPGLCVLDVRDHRELLVHRLDPRRSRLERALTEPEARA